MWQRNELTERLGLTWPIVQAPMAGSTTPQLAAAVDAAGGLGSLGCGTQAVEASRAQIEEARRLGARLLNVNFFCHAQPTAGGGDPARMRELLAPFFAERGLGEPPPPALPYPSFGPEHLALVEATRPEVVSFHFGLPEPAMVAAVKATGAMLWSSATTVEEARWLEARGVDVVIAQGAEAGGHRGTFLGTDPSHQAGTMALMPQVADAVRCRWSPPAASPMVGASPRPSCSGRARSSSAPPSCAAPRPPCTPRTGRPWRRRATTRPE
jgi:nitronate monooxygenase